MLEVTFYRSLSPGGDGVARLSSPVRCVLGGILRCASSASDVLAVAVGAVLVVHVLCHFLPLLQLLGLLIVQCLLPPLFAGLVALQGVPTFYPPDVSFDDC